MIKEDMHNFCDRKILIHKLIKTPINQNIKEQSNTKQAKDIIRQVIEEEMKSL